jgi:hypothetical protein
MTTLELRKSIIGDLDMMSEEMLEKMSSYGKGLLSHKRKQVKPLFDKPTKIEISEETKRISGRFPLPADFNYKEFNAEMRLKDYLAL